MYIILLCVYKNIEVMLSVSSFFETPTDDVNRTVLKINQTDFDYVLIIIRQWRMWSTIITLLSILSQFQTQPSSRPSATRPHYFPPIRNMLIIMDILTTVRYFIIQNILYGSDMLYNMMHNIKTKLHIFIK